MTGGGRTPHLSPWGRLVAACAILVIGGAATLGIFALSSAKEVRSSYAVRGSLESIVVDAGAGDVTVVRGRGRESVGVQRTDRSTFGHWADTRRAVTGRVLRLRSRCPVTVLHTCSVSYRLIIPDNLSVEVRTTSGSVSIQGMRGAASVVTESGDVDVSDFCGFVLRARSGEGHLSVATACPVQRLSVRSTSGDVDAVVPPGRYTVDAESAGSSVGVTGVTEATDAPFAIQALSGSGRVRVRGIRDGILP